MSVALRKESVDRNIICLPFLRKLLVALRKESVDRNIRVNKTQRAASMSLSARRAWIEIFGGVGQLIKSSSRSPQGERG